MFIFKQVSDLQKYLAAQKRKGLRVGFAPTMGALHRGHVSLIERSRAECEVTVASIFVNPTQFNDPKDLEKYPRTPERDIELLAENGCDVLFMPSASEVYPTDLPPSVKFNFGKLDRVLEGEFRPNHFDGVAQVMLRLLDIIQPDALFMGQKDFQQFTIVARMIDLAKIKTQIIMCPITRQDDGLAMSSRNVRLSAEGRAAAPLIFKTLSEAADMVGEYSPTEIQQTSMTKLKAEPLFRVQYFDIVDGRTLMPIRLFEDTDFAVALVAVWVGDVRLIDNLILKQTTIQDDEE